MSRLFSSVLSLALLTAAPGLADDECPHRADRSTTLDAAGARVLEVRARAGELDIVGEPGLAEVRIQGTACASDADDLEDIRLETRRRGDRLVVEVEIPESNWGWNDKHRALHLEIAVPASLALEVDDGSGSLTITNVASLELDDGSGEISIRDVAGDVTIDDGSGSMELERLGGELDIDDGSGSIFARWVHGPVRIDDGSGEIDVRDVETDVEIGDDGSGSIEIADVKGSVHVGRDGSGSIQVARVGGDFSVRNDGSGGVSHRDVGGRVDIPRD